MQAQTRLVPVGADREPVVRRLHQLYRHDLSEFRDSPPSPEGTFTERRLETFFTGDPDRLAYEIWHGEHLAGFTLLYGVVSPPRQVFAFFVARAFRRQRVGHAAARQLVSAHPGRWTISFQEENPRAARFWRQLGRELAGDATDEERRPVPDKDWLPPDVFLGFDTTRS